MNASTPTLHLDLSPLTVPALLGESAAALAPIKVAALAFVRKRVAPAGKIDRELIDQEQHIVHGLAWVATYVETLREVSNWALRLQDEGLFGETESSLSCLLFANYLGDLKGGIAMNQGETIRPAELGLEAIVEEALLGPASAALLAAATQELKTRTADLVAQSQGKGTIEVTGLDETYEMVRDTFRRFGQEKVAPFAHGWHLRDELIPMELIGQLAEMGVFGLTIPEEFGGLGLSKTSMVVVSEELSRGYIGVGSLATRSEIAAELILCGGTPLLPSVRCSSDEQCGD
jgi:(2S)-methylsuccinyl-CoA dehydrogenase